MRKERKERSRRYEAHKEELKERSRRYYEAHKEELKERKHRRYEAHKKKRKSEAAAALKSAGVKRAAERPLKSGGGRGAPDDTALFLLEKRRKEREAEELARLPFSEIKRRLGIQ
jgi:hypothetical protein